MEYVLLCLTASHKNADIDLLERLSVCTDVAGSLTDGTPFVSGALVVATCNRYEVYLDVDEPLTAASAVAAEAVFEAVATSSCVAESTLRSSFETLCGHAAAEHAFAVSAGLESVVVGEGEVAGQVRRALQDARKAGTTSPLLEHLFQRASGTSRRVKNTTGIQTVGRSLVRLACDLAETRVSDWRETRILLIGTGRYAATSLGTMRERGATDIHVYSPTGRAPAFAGAHDVEPVAAEDYAREAAAAGIVVACTATVEPVLDARILRAGREANAARMPAIHTGAADIRQLVIDLGLPRNASADVTDVSGVELLDLDTIRLHAPIEQSTAPEAARRLVGRAAQRFAEAAAEREVTPAVVALRRHVYDILDAEIERARPHDDGRTEAALRHLAGVLLHRPMVEARRLARDGRADEFAAALDAVFGIRMDEAASDAECG